MFRHQAGKPAHQKWISRFLASFSYALVVLRVDSGIKVIRMRIATYRLEDKTTANATKTLHALRRDDV